MAVPLEFIASTSYFSGLGRDELDDIIRLFFEKAVNRGEIVSLEGEPAEALYFVVSGAVKILKTSASGKEQILSIVRPGESFNDVPVFDGGPNLASAQAMGPVILYGITKSELEAITSRHLHVALNIIKVLASRLRQLVSLVEDLSFRHVIGRIAKILLENAGDSGGAKTRLTQQEMAAMAGTAREVASRSLRALEGEGSIRLDRHRIVITDKKALEEIVKASF